MTETEQQSYIISMDLEREILYAVILVIIGSLIYFTTQLKKSTGKNFIPDVKHVEHIQPANLQKPSNKKKKGVGNASKESRKPFAHQFLKKTLKGHGNKVLDMDVSSNGKLLASCSEDAPITGSNTLSRLKSAPNSRDKKGKCVTKAGDNDSDVKKPLEKNNNTTIINMNSKRPPLFNKYCQKLEKESSVLHTLLQQYVLSSEQLIFLGYPCKIDSNSSEVVIIKQPELSSQFNTFGTVYYKQGKRTNCSRCNQDFFISYGNSYLTLQKCAYHWGKLTKDVDNKSVYTCCQSKIGASGCELSDYHVWSGLQPGINGPFYDYATFDSKFCKKRLEVFALDCEMCYTFNGLELSRVTVVNIDGNLVYNEYVKLDQVIDLNTRYSGITQEHLQNATKTLKDVQNDLMQIISSESILVGHGLDNDLRALKVYHQKVIDTCVLYPHYYGLPYRRSLRSLVSSILDRNIQMSSSGHDSVEDARASLELLLWKVTKDIGYLLR